MEDLPKQRVVHPAELRSFVWVCSFLSEQGKQSATASEGLERSPGHYLKYSSQDTEVSWSTHQAAPATIGIIVNPLWAMPMSRGQPEECSGPGEGEA